MTKGEEDKDEKGKTTEDNCFSAGFGFHCRQLCSNHLCGGNCETLLYQDFNAVMAVNLGSNEDVSHGGTNFKKQSAYSNLKVEVKGPSDSAYPPEQSMLSRLFRQRIAMKTMDWKSKTARMREAQRTWRI